MTETSVFTPLKRIEQHYANENELIRAVMDGRIQRAEIIMDEIAENFLKHRITSSSRNFKNYAIAVNTLLRKAAEYGSVSPAKLYRVSEEFTKKIELAPSEKAIFSILKNMAHKYTQLVKNHSLKGYSPLVRKVMVHVECDLSADLSLKTHAKLLHVNPSYLSTVFKKETGYTITEYVSKKRMQYAAHLLRTTDLQIQIIAQYCGIHDMGYFTRIFKKYTGKTPTEYRKNIL